MYVANHLVTKYDRDPLVRLERGYNQPRSLPMWFWLDSCHDRYCVAIGNHSSKQPRVCDYPFCESRWICGMRCHPSLVLFSPLSLFVPSCPLSSSLHPSLCSCDHGWTSTSHTVHLDPWSHVEEEPPTYHTSSLRWSGHQQEFPNWMDIGNLMSNSLKPSKHWFSQMVNQTLTND